jgi:hypothetical protein
MYRKTQQYLRVLGCTVKNDGIGGGMELGEGNEWVGKGGGCSERSWV